MRICILTGYFAPEITAETHLLLDLAQDFVKYNAEVIVITSFPSRGIDKSTKLKYRKIREEITTNNYRIKRVGFKWDEGNNFILRSLRYILLSNSIYRAAKKTGADVYLISSTPPFLGIVGALLARKTPTVYNLQDIFPASLLTTKKTKKGHLLFSLFRWFENYIYKKNSHIIAISNDFKEIVISKGIPIEKVSVVYNWVDSETIHPVKRSDNSLISRYNLDRNAFYITYCGNIGYTQNLEMVIDVAKRLEATIPEIKFILIGEGAWYKHIVNYVKTKKSNNISFIPFQPYENIASVFSLGDISLVCSKKNVGIGSIPSKTWSIMAASRAVLCSFDIQSELCSIITKAECGLCVESENGIEFENAIKFLYKNRDKTELFGINGRNFVIQNLSRKNCTQLYFDILSSLFKSHNKKSSNIFYEKVI